MNWEKVLRLLHNIWFFISKLIEELISDARVTLRSKEIEASKEKIVDRTTRKGRIYHATGVNLGSHRLYRSLSAVRHFWRSIFVVDMKREAVVGQITPNSRVIDFDTKLTKRILDFQKLGRPLVLNLGSCS